MVRQQVHDLHSLGVYLLPGKHTYQFFKSKEEIGEPLEIAVVIGVDPALVISSLHLGSEDELTVAGALREEPVKLVKCETVDLEVPDTSEIVIEGKVVPKERRKEGPFGECTGHYATVGMRPFMEVTCITHRKNPIFLCTYEGKPPNEDSCLSSVPFAASTYMHAVARCPEITGLRLIPASRLHYGIASLKKRYPGHARVAMQAIWATQRGLYGLKWLVIVDDDIDIYDDKEVEWAIFARYQPERDTVILSKTLCSPLDPSSWPRGLGSKMGMDATLKMPEEGGPPKDESPKIIDDTKNPYWNRIISTSLKEYLAISETLITKD